MKKKIFAGIGAIALLVVACGKVDNFLPNVDDLNVIGGGSGFSFIPLGQNVVVNYTVSDDDLGEINFELKKGFHQEDSVRTTANDFYVRNVANISGGKQSGSFQYPTDVSMGSGPYHMRFEVIDANRNRGKISYLNFVLQPDPSIIDIVWEDLLYIHADDTTSLEREGNTFLAQRAKEIIPKGRVFCPNGLAEIKLDMVNEQRGFQIGVVNYTDSAFTQFDLAEFGIISVDSSSSTGNKIFERFLYPPYAMIEEYTLMLQARDVNGNCDVAFFEIKLD